MKDLEKKAKLKVLGGFHKGASDVMKKALSGYKDSDKLKKHVKQMSEDTKIDFKNDSDNIVDPIQKGNVVGRHISDENIDCSPDDMSVYDIDEKLEKLMAKKSKIKGKGY